MHRKFPLSLALVGVLTLLVTAAPVAAEDCASFDGVEHCALGSSTLSQTPEGLSVEGIGDAPENGVALSFGNATSWRAAADARGNGSGTASLRTAAIADGQTTSTATIQQAGERIELSATYTGAGAQSTYSALVYNDGVFQRGVGGLANNQRAAYVDYNDPLNPWNPYEPIHWFDWWWWWPWHGWGFDILSTNQACQWTVQLEEPVSFHLADGSQVMGDEIRLVEEVTEPGGYVYLSFDGITAQGDLESLVFTSESVSGR